MLHYIPTKHTPTTDLLTQLAVAAVQSDPDLPAIDTPLSHLQITQPHPIKPHFSRYINTSYRLQNWSSLTVHAPINSQC